MLELKNLTKRYGAHTAVDGLSLHVKAGERLGLLGPNGAGKTTTISMIVGALVPTSGEILLGGKPIRRDDDPVKRTLGYVPQELALYDDLSARDNLTFFGALYDLRGPKLSARIDSCLDLVGLSDRHKDAVKTFSGGMKRRLNLAAALLHEPELLLLDEPTVGVDPQSRNAIFENLETLARGGMTLVYTTHYMEEVERLCDRIAIVDHGKLIARGTLDELRGHVARDGIRLRVTVAADDTAKLRPENLPIGATILADGFSAPVSDLSSDAAKVLQSLAAANIVPIRIASDAPGLEDVFLHLTGKNLRDV